MCESGLSGWMVKACFHAAIAAAVFSSRVAHLYVSSDKRTQRTIGDETTHGDGIQLPIRAFRSVSARTVFYLHDVRPPHLHPS